MVGEIIKTWDSKLPQAEFSHNYAVNSSSRYSPFQVIYGIVPRGPVDHSLLPYHFSCQGGAATFVEELT